MYRRYRRYRCTDRDFPGQEAADGASLERPEARPNFERTWCVKGRAPAFAADRSDSMFRAVWQRLTRSQAPPSRRRRGSCRSQPALEFLEDRITPATYTVTNLSDSPTPPFGMDLRQAIALADQPANAGSTIKFSVNGTITMLQGEYRITEPMTIDATGHTVAVDAAARSRVFSISNAGTVTFTGLTIKNGKASTASTDGSGNGGGIYDASPSSVLVLNSDKILVNKASASSAVTGSGGGAFSNGIVAATSTTVDGNTAPGKGGGIYAAKNITLNSCTISNNTAATGGGIYQAGTGTTLTLNQSNVVTNKAISGGGGGAWALFNVSATGGTVNHNTALGFGNGGGIQSNQGNVTLNGTTVSTNTATGSGGGVWAKYNIYLKNKATVSTNIGNTGGGGLWSLAGVVNIQSSSVTLNLAGAGTNSSGGANIGDGGGIWSGTDVALNAAALVAHNTANGNGGGIFALRNVADNGGTVLDNNAVSSLFDPDTGDALNGNGGGIWAGSDILLNGGKVTTNTAGVNGGGVYSAAGNVFVTAGATVGTNTTGQDGGGVWDEGGDVEVDASTVTGNQANNNGGGIFVGASSSSMGGSASNGNSTGSLIVHNNSTISNNSCVNEGGGIYVENIESVTVDSSSITGNTASLNGGGIAAHNIVNISITSSSLASNDATSGSGGAVYVVGPADVYIDSDSITGNTAGVSGGGVYLSNVDATISNCEFDDNLSYGGPTTGSALFADTGATVDLYTDDFDDTSGLSSTLSTDLIDVGGSGSSMGVIRSSGGNTVWDGSWVNVTNFGFAGSGDVGNDQS
jgi:predicted outer membrane repeat protein